MSTIGIAYSGDVAIKHYPAVEKLCGMMASSDLMWRGHRITRIRYGGDYRIILDTFEGEIFSVKKIDVDLLEFKPV